MWVILKKEFQERYYLILIGLVGLLGLQQHSYQGLDARNSYPLGMRNLPWKSAGGMMDFFYPDRHMHIWLFILFGAVVGVMTFVSTSRSEYWSFLRQRAISPIQIQLGRLVFAFLAVALPGVLYMARQAYWFAKPGNLPLPWTNEYLIIFSLPTVWALAVVPVMALSALPHLKRWMRAVPAFAYLGCLFHLYPEIKPGLWHNSIWVSWIGALCISGLGVWAFSKISKAGQLRGPYWPSILFISGVLPWLVLGAMIIPITNKICQEEVLQIDVFFAPRPWRSYLNGTEFRVTRAGIPIEIDRTQEKPFRNLLNRQRIDLIGERDLVPYENASVLFPETKQSTKFSVSRNWSTKVEPLGFETTEQVGLVYYWLKQENLISFYRWDTFELGGALGRNGVGKTRDDVEPFGAIKGIVTYIGITKLKAPVFWIRTQEGTYLWNTTKKRVHFFNQVDFDKFSRGPGTLYAMGDGKLVQYDPSTDRAQTLDLPESMEAADFYFVYMTDNGYAFREMRRWREGDSFSQTHYVLLSKTGEVIHDTYLALEYEQAIDYQALRRDARDMGAKLALLPGFQWYSSPLNPLFGELLEFQLFDFKLGLKLLRTLLLKNGLISLIYFAIVFLILKRSKKHVWYGMLIVLAGGPMASALILFHLSVPHAPCPSCGRNRPTHGESCDHCGNAYPEPAVTAWR